MDRGYDTRSPIQKKSSVPRTVAFFRLYLITLGIFALCGLFLVIAYAPLFRIQGVVVSGASDEQNQNIKVYILKALEGSWHTLLPLNSVVSVPTQSFEKNTRETFPFVRDITITKSGVGTLTVQVDPRVPTYTFCEIDSCVTLDDTGIIFGLEKKSEGLPIIEGDISDFVKRSLVGQKEQIVFGGYLLDQTSLTSLDKAVSFLKSENFHIKKIQLLSLGFFDVTAVDSVTGKESNFRFREGAKLQQSLEELKLAFDRGLLEKIRTTQVEYVISYVPQKVIYKSIAESRE